MLCGIGGVICSRYELWQVGRRRLIMILIMLLRLTDGMSDPDHMARGLLLREVYC